MTAATPRQHGGSSQCLGASGLAPSPLEALATLVAAAPPPPQLRAAREGAGRRASGNEARAASGTAHPITPPLPRHSTYRARPTHSSRPSPSPNALFRAALMTGISAPHTLTNTEQFVCSVEQRRLQRPGYQDGCAASRDMGTAWGGAEARRPGRAALCVCCAMVLAAVSQEADAQQTEEVSCPFDLPEGGWEEGQATTRYCCKPIYWGRGPDLHRARA